MFSGWQDKKRGEKNREKVRIRKRGKRVEEQRKKREKEYSHRLEDERRERC